MWPFHKKERISIEQAAALEPMPPCNEPVMHLTWKLNGIGCPACASIKERNREIAKENRLVEKIAESVVRKMKENK